MRDTLERWKRLTEGFTQRLAKVRDDQWTAPTPCSEFNVRQLVEHALDVQRMIPKALGVTGAIETPIGNDPKAAWLAIREAALAAYTTEGALDIEVELPIGNMPAGDALGGPPSGDLLIHTWDLARAIGADETLPEDAVTAVLQLLQGFGDDILRQPGRFGPKIDLPEGANAQTELLCYTGRQP